MNIYPPVIAILIGIASTAQAATFRGLGDLPGSNFLSVATGVSSNGTVIVGYSSSTNGIQTFRWTAATGLIGLGELPGGLYSSFANAVSADGAVSVGNSRSASGDEAFRWTEGVGMRGLGDLPGGNFFSFATSVSVRGDVVVGFSVSAASGTRPEAFRWTTTNGMMGLGNLPGGNFNSRAWGVSADGNVIVGESSSSTSGSNREAFQWREGVMTGLGDIPGGTFHSIAHSVSADGSVIVGYSLPPSDVHEAFRWTEGIMTPLGFLPCDTWSIARAVSGDGLVVVGDPQTANGGCVFIWDAQRGMRDLHQVFTLDYGFDLTGWRLDRATALSHDGSVIVGYGINPSGTTEAWVADLSLPTLDIQRDGNLVILSWPTNFADFLLETSTAINGDGWQTPSAPMHRVADKFAVTNTATANQQFFRLRQQ